VLADIALRGTAPRNSSEGRYMLLMGAR